MIKVQHTSLLLTILGFLLRQAAKPSPDKKPNYFFIPPRFVHPCIIAAPYQGALNPRLAFYLRAFCVNLPKSVDIFNLFL